MIECDSLGREGVFPGNQEQPERRHNGDQLERARDEAADSAEYHDACDDMEIHALQENLLTK